MSRPYPNLPPGLTHNMFMTDVAAFMKAVQDNEGAFGASFSMINRWYWKLRAILDDRPLTEADFTEVVVDAEIRVILGLFFLWNPELQGLAALHKSGGISDRVDDDRTMMHRGES